MNLITRSLLLAAITLLPLLVFGQTRYYVKADAVGADDGSSWANAFTDLRSALNAAVHGDTIWVAQGTYLPSDTGNRHLSFNLKNGVSMFGGFTGNETSLPQRNWSTNPTLLSGDIGVQGDTSDNSYTIVFATNLDSTTLMDGFVVTLGNANSSAPNEPISGRTKSGGGMYLASNSTVLESRPTIRNCQFLNNYARSFGGGVYMASNNFGNITPAFQNCEFISNYAQRGGGIYKKGSSSAHIMQIDSCLFRQNKANFGGGICHINDFGSLGFSVNNCNFLENSDFLVGGCLYIEHGNSVDVEYNFSNSLFKGNLDETLYLPSSCVLGSFDLALSGNNINFKGCVFDSNLSIGDAPIFVESETKFESCCIIANKGLGNGNSFLFAGSQSNIHINNCLFYGNSSVAPILDINLNDAYIKLLYSK